MDKRFEKFAKSWLGEDWDKVDIESQWDSELTLNENINQFKANYFKEDDSLTQSKMWEEEQQDHLTERQREELVNAFGEFEFEQELKIPDMPTIEHPSVTHESVLSEIEKEWKELTMLYGEDLALRND